MAVLPARLVELEFDAGVWTDVSADVVSISTRRGRNKESGAFEAGTMTVTLRNDSRKYDPDNTAGTYYGKLRPNRRIRFRATYNAVTYPVYQGYIDRITQQWSGPNDATASIEATDLFKLLARADLPVSAYATEVAADSPAYWWRLGEPAGSTVVRDQVAALQAAVTGASFGLGAAGLVTRDPGGAATFVAEGATAYSRSGAIATLTTPITTYPLTLSAIVSLTGGSGGDILKLRTLDSGAYDVAKLSSDGTNAFFTTIAGGTQRTVSGTAAISGGSPHLVTGVWDAAGLMTLYVDGVSTGTPVAAAAAFNPATRIVIGGPAEYGGGGFVGTIDEPAVFTTAVSAARIAVWSSARATPWNGDLPGTRLGRVLDLAAVPAGDRTLDAGTTILQATSLGTDPLSYAQKVEETEAGRLFVTRDGKVRFIGRQAGDTGTYLTSLATLVDDDSGAGLPYLTASADVDEARIVTRATVSRDGSVAITYYDAAAKAEFGWIDETHDGLLHATDTYSRAYAEWIVNTHKTPASRVGTVTLELAKDPVNLYPGILVLELADRLTWKRKPQNVGAIVTQAMRIESVAHETGGHYWRTSLLLSPFNLGVSGYGTGVWDTSLWDQSVWGL
jgi:hypothetical protein